MVDLYTIAKNAKSKDDFVTFLNALLQNLNNNPQEWENTNLSNYLEAMQSWTEDMEGYYINQNLPLPENVHWKVFADILMAARIYE